MGAFGFLFGRFESRRVCGDRRSKKEEIIFDFRGVLSSWRTSVYNFPICFSPRFVCRPFLSFFCATICFAWPGLLRGDSLDDGVRVLARKVGEMTRGAAVEVKEENKSSLRESQVTELEKAFVEELRRSGAKIVQQGVQTKITLTLSENASGYLGVVRLQHGGDSQDVIQLLGRALEEAGIQQSVRMTLRRELLNSSEQPILDVVFPHDDANRMVVLSPTQLVDYDRDGSTWKANAPLKLPRIGLSTRDLRGRVDVGLDELNVIFPAEICNISTRDGDRCHASRGQVNFSSMPEQSLKEITPGLDAVEFQNGGQKTVIVVGKDRKMRLYHDDSEPFQTTAEYGDQISSIQSGCGSGQQVLVTERGDGTAADTVQAVEIRDDKLALVAQPMQFGGPVTMLRAASRTLGFPDTAAIAVVHNLQSGNYEAYRLTISCGN